MKRRIDIEKLLHWALVEELPKGQPVSRDIGDIIGRRFRQRTIVGFAANFTLGGFREVDSLGFAPGAPHEDALRIEQAWCTALPRQRVALDGDVADLFGDMVAIADDGAFAALLRMEFDLRSLLQRMIVQGCRPDWRGEQPRPHRQMLPNADGASRSRPRVRGTDHNGNLVDMLPRRGKAAMMHGLYDLGMQPHSPLTWDPSPFSIAENRADYVAYFDALEIMRAALDGSLVEFDVLPAPIARMPWKTGQITAPRVLRPVVAAERVSRQHENFAA